MNSMYMDRRPPSSTPVASSSRRAEAKARTRQKVLEAAKSLFMERGYEAATIRDIAARADLSTGAVFASFADKADLFNAVLAQDLERQLELWREEPVKDDTLASALLAFFVSGYRFHLSQLPLLQAATGLSWSHGLQGPLGNRPAYRFAMTTAGEMLRGATERGELPRDADTSLLSELMWDAYLSNFRYALFDNWGLEELTALFDRQIRVVLGGAAASAKPA